MLPYYSWLSVYNASRHDYLVRDGLALVDYAGVIHRVLHWCICAMVYEYMRYYTPLSRYAPGLFLGPTRNIYIYGGVYDINSVSRSAPGRATLLVAWYS